MSLSSDGVDVAELAAASYLGFVRPRTEAGGSSLRGSSKQAERRNRAGRIREPHHNFFVMKNSRRLRNKDRQQGALGSVREHLAPNGFKFSKLRNACPLAWPAVRISSRRLPTYLSLSIFKVN